MAGQTDNQSAAARELARLKRPFGGRRLLSWILFFSVLGGYLALPGVAALRAAWVPFLAEPAQEARVLAARPDPQKPPDYIEASNAKAWHLADQTGHTYPPPTVAGLDRVWNPGPMSAAHAPWSGDCKVCHSTPFKRVQDADCLGCHKLIHAHVDPARVDVPALAARCASCHQEHRGTFALAEQNRHAVGRDCADCHSEIRAQYPQTETRPVSDFADAHPQFRVQLREHSDKPGFQRVRLPAKGVLKEATTLKFPHDVHLKRSGVRSPTGKQQMKCADCHVPGADGVGFKPVTMVRHCQSCHALKMEPALSNREVPHGPVPAVLDTLREFYVFVATTGTVPREPGPLTDTVLVRRPGESRTPRVFATAAGDAHSRASASAVELFEKTACVVCHDVKRLAGKGKPGTPGADLPQWKIAPVPKAHGFMPKALFDHSAHSTASCETCHGARTSAHAEEVLMPGIKTCRDCHAGSRPAPDKVASDCGLCHGFHWPGTTVHAAVPGSPEGNPQ
jgi:hypothetical protein